MLAQPLLDFFSLRREHDALPFQDAGSLAVLGHNIRAFVQHLDQTVGFGSLKVVGGKGRVFLQQYLYNSRWRLYRRNTAKTALPGTVTLIHFTNVPRKSI